jgi:hypothetical protein
LSQSRFSYPCKWFHTWVQNIEPRYKILQCTFMGWVGNFTPGCETTNMYVYKVYNFLPGWNFCCEETISFNQGSMLYTITIFSEFQQFFSIKPMLSTISMHFESKAPTAFGKDILKIIKLAPADLPGRSIFSNRYTETSRYLFLNLNCGRKVFGQIYIL